MTSALTATHPAALLTGGAARWPCTASFAPTAAATSPPLAARGGPNIEGLKGGRQHPFGATRPANAAATRGMRPIRAGPLGRYSGGREGGGPLMRTSILYDRMKTLRAKDKDPAEDQAIVPSICVDSAKRQTPSAKDYPALIEHLLSTPAEEMKFEGIRCSHLLTPVFLAHIAAQVARRAGGCAGLGTIAALQALDSWVRVTREGLDAADPDEVPAPAHTPPITTAGDKLSALLSAAGGGVDVLRCAIVELARAREIDDALLTLLSENAYRARVGGDYERGSFLTKVAEVCIREKNAASEQ
mmetsp:Transcript_7524/g.18667  ORF Transcript_7524/g.18667 Transcript_7524/m.18667 type:complete len:301 (-) Transcript_7524:153-1055(-)